MDAHDTSSPITNSNGPGVRRRRDVLWRVAPNYLALSTVTGEAVASSGPAPDIWELLHEWTTVDEAAGALALRYEADVERVRIDVAAFVDLLIDGGYVERASGPDGC